MARKRTYETVAAALSHVTRESERAYAAALIADYFAIEDPRFDYQKFMGVVHGAKVVGSREPKPSEK